MSAIAELLLKIQGKDQASGEIRKVNKSLGGLSKSLGDMGKIAGGVLLAKGFAKIPGAIGGITGMAADLELQMKKANTVFGDSIGIVKEWSAANAGAMGLTRSEATNLAAGLADLLIPMGMERDLAAKMATETIGLSGALAEWSGGKVSAAQAADILSKAYLGEREGLKQLGISILDADVKQRLLEKGQSDLTGQALEQAKALATQELIFEKSTDAQKAYAEGTGSAARKQAEMRAKMKELRETIVRGLSPAIVKITTWLAEKLPAAIDLGREMFERHLQPVLERVRSIIQLDVIPAITKLARAIVDKLEGPIRRVVKFFKEHESAWQAAAFGIGTVLALAFTALAISAGIAAINVIIATAPLIALIAVVAAVGAGIFLLVKHWDDLTARWPFLQTMLDGLKTGFWAVANFITGTLIPAIASLVSWFRVNVLPVLAAVAGFVVGTLVPALVSIGAWIVTNIIPRIWSLVTTFVSLHIRVGQIIGGIIAAFWPFVMLVFGAVRQIGGDLLRIGDKFAGFMGRVIGLVNPIINIIKTLIEWIGRIPNPVGWAGDLWNAVGGVIPGQQGAHGTMFARGGLTLVGEHGPELVRMPRGSQIYTATQTAAMVRGGSSAPAGGGTNIYLTVNALDAPGAADAVLAALTQLERTGRVRVVTS